MSQSWRRTLRDWTPPALLRIGAPFLNQRIRLLGNYSNWNEALAKCQGYHSAHILSRVLDATEEVARGEAAFERDGMVFNQPQPPYPLIAALLRAAVINRNRLCVIDFGGALGSSYRQCLPFLENLQQLQWNVVEQADFVKIGREVFENDTLRFFESIAACAQEAPPTVILFSGVLQYLEDYVAAVEQAVGLTARTIIIDRTPLVALPGTRIARQIVPRRLGSASYPIQLFAREQLLKPFLGDYVLLNEFDAVDDMMTYGLTRVEFKGFILDRSTCGV